MSESEYRRPENGYWVLRRWLDQKPIDVHLSGSFTAGELRWLADDLDRANNSEPPFTWK